MEEKEKNLLIQTAALLAERMDDQDLISGCVNVRYGGDYDLEEEARVAMYYTYVEIAYIIHRSMRPLMESMSEPSWKNLLMKTINQIGIKIGFVYTDNDETCFEEEADIVYSLLTNKTPKPSASEIYQKELETLVNRLVEHNVYPMAADRYKKLLENRDLDFPEKL